MCACATEQLEKEIFELNRQIEDLNTDLHSKGKLEVRQARRPCGLHRCRFATDPPSSQAGQHTDERMRSMAGDGSLALNGQESEPPQKEPHILYRNQHD